MRKTGTQRHKSCGFVNRPVSSPVINHDALVGFLQIDILETLEQFATSISFQPAGVSDIASIKISLGIRRPMVASVWAKMYPPFVTYLWLLGRLKRAQLPLSS